MHGQMFIFHMYVTDLANIHTLELIRLSNSHFIYFSCPLYVFKRLRSMFSHCAYVCNAYTMCKWWYPAHFSISYCINLFKRCTKKGKGTPGFEPGTSRSAVECSTTELYPLLIRLLNRLVI